jgi:hypothetical protein
MLFFRLINLSGVPLRNIKGVLMRYKIKKKPIKFENFKLLTVILKKRTI